MLCLIIFKQHQKLSMHQRYYKEEKRFQKMPKALRRQFSTTSPPAQPTTIR